MADQYSNESSSSSNISQECLDSTVQLNIKTLDSRIFSFQVNKNMPVLVFKEKIASDIGVPVGQQRLIFRGKVLKDDHPLSEYHVENGHTLHLVERQPAQSQLPSNVSPGETSANTVNRGNDSTEGAPRNRVGQISHSVVLGTFNVGEQGEGINPDLSRVVGAVLNSIGISSQAATNSSGGTQFVLPSHFGLASQGNEGGANVNLRNQNQGGNQAQSGQTVPNRPLTSFPQLMQIPVAAAAVQIPSFDVPIPDSLNTLTVFMNRLENVLSRNGGNQPNSSSSNVADLPRVELPSNAQGLPTAEVLSAVLRSAQRLLSEHAASSLSHIAGRLEQEGASLDSNIRGQIQTESVQVGLAMQQLGALFLELGRAILTLRMGQSPEESVVNAGPAVYISPSGPNPIMVQPFPLQTSSLFGASPPSNPFNLGPAGVGNPPRHINIHIHAVGTRPNNTDGLLGGQNETGSLDSGAPRALPVRNIIPSTVPPHPNIITAALPLHPNIVTAVPPRPAGITFSTPAQPDQGFSISLPSSESVISSSVMTDSERSLVVDTQEDSMVQPVKDIPSATISNNNEAATSTSEDGRKKSHMESNETNVLQDLSTSSAGRTAGNSEDVLENIDRSIGKTSVTEGVQAVPLGLGLGGLGQRKPGRQLKMQDKRSTMGETSSGLSDQNKKMTAVSTGQQILQSLASSKATDRSKSSNSASRSPSSVSPVMDGGPLQGNDCNGQIDLTSAMSRALQNPALNGFLTGVSDQLGTGSPDVLRNMLHQVTQSPQMRNTVNEIARQIDTQEVERMFTGMGSGQSGSLDFQKIFQQMMPVVSRVFNRGSTETFPSMETDLQPNIGRSLNTIKLGQNSQVDVQPVVQSIERQSPPGDIFRAVVESAVQFADDNDCLEDVVEELCTEDELISDYLDILRQDLSKRLEGDGDKKSRYS